MKLFLSILCTSLIVLPCYSKDLPRIEILGKATVDFGKYPASEKKIAKYTIRNAGKGILQIKKLRKTCGCAWARIDKKTLEPNEEAHIEVTIIANSIFGKYSKSTFVDTNDPKKRFMRLGVSGEAIPLVGILPKAQFYAGRIQTNTTWSQEFMLKPTKKGVELGEVIVKSNYPIEAALEDVEGHYTLRTTLLPVMTSGDLKCSLEIPVVAPSNAAPLKINITGKIGTQLIAIPSIAHIPLSNDAVVRKFYLRVLGVKGVSSASVRCER